MKIIEKKKKELKLFIEQTIVQKLVSLSDLLRLMRRCFKGNLVNFGSLLSLLRML